MSPDADNRHGVTGRRATDPQPLFDSSARGRILAAAAAIAVRGGYRDATVERVVEQAHATWTDFTTEFDSLEDCFLAAQAAAFDCGFARAERAARAAGPQASPQGAFDAALTGLLDAIAAHGEIARLALFESAALGAKGIERKEAGLQRFVGLLQERAAGAGASVPPLAAEMVAGGIYEILQREVAVGEIDRPWELADELRRLWLPLIAAHAPRK